jgi:hypothetical protein
MLFSKKARAYSDYIMKENEYDIFSQLEHEMGRDLTQWRRHIVASFERCCLAAFETEEAKTDDALDLTDPSVRESVKWHTVELLIAEWINIKDSPHPGDFISATGESYWHTMDTSSGELTTFRLPIGYKIEGSLQHWDILPYIDEAGLEERVHRDPELAYQHTHPFGLHLILDDPTITTDAGRLLPIHPDKIYLPIHYARTELKIYSEPN